jgi:hypothetical protein
MNMIPLRLRLILPLLGLISALGGVVPAAAQDSAPFSFAAPLRPRIVFAYRYAERVRMAQRVNGGTIDSSDRLLTYFITERQMAGENGTWTIEANIDSMRVDFNGAAGRALFNTQELGGNEAMVRHREVLIPSSLVNRLVTFTLSPYGEIIDMKSEGLTELVKQASDPGIDQFTRDRLMAYLSKERLASIYFPWRGVTPMGQQMTYGKALSQPFITALDELPVRDTAMLQLVRPKGDEQGPHLLFSAPLGTLISNKLTVSAFEKPLVVKSVEGKVTGDLSLEEDGVVRSGWVTTTATTRGNLDGRDVTTSITEEVFINQIGMMQF